MKRSTGMLCLCLLICTFPAQYVHAEDAEASDYKENLSTGQSILMGAYVVGLAEGLAALNSGLATASPEVYGSVCGITSPLVLASTDNPVVNITSFVLFLGICAYNLTAPSNEEMSDREVFTNNMIAWHIFYLGTGAAYALTYDKYNDVENKSQIALLPISDGAMVVWSFRF